MAFASSRIGAQEAIVKPCDLCEDDENVNWFCKDCVKNLCERCRKGHVKIDICKNHFIVSMLEGVAITKENVSNLCKEHSVPFSFFCRSCGEVVCSKCLSRDHNKHIFIDVHEFQSEMQNELDDIFKEKEREKEQMIQDLEVLDSYESECSETLAQNYSDIDDMVKAIQHASFQEREVMKKSLKSSTESKLSEVCESKQRLKNQTIFYDEEIRTIKQNLMLQTVPTLNQFVCTSISRLRSLRTLSLPAPMSMKFTVGSINKEHIRDMIGKVEESRPSRSGKKEVNRVHQRLQTVCLYKLNVKTYCYGVCSCQDGSIWVGGKAFIYKMNFDCSVTLLQIPTRASNFAALTCHYIACLRSGDALVSYGGQENYIDRFTPDGRRVEFTSFTSVFTNDISVTDRDEVIIGVCDRTFSSQIHRPISSLLIFSNNGIRTNEIKMDECISSFCVDKEDHFVTSHEDITCLSIMDRHGNVKEKVQITNPKLQRMSCDRYGNVLGLPEGAGIKEILLISAYGKVERSFNVECYYGINDFCIDCENRLLILVDDKKIIVAEYLI